MRKLGSQTVVGASSGFDAVCSKDISIASAGFASCTQGARHRLGRDSPSCVGRCAVNLRHRFALMQPMPAKEIVTHAALRGTPRFHRPNPSPHLFRKCDGNGIHAVCAERLRGGDLDYLDSGVQKRCLPACIGVDLLGAGVKLRAVVFHAKLLLGPKQIGNKIPLPAGALGAFGKLNRVVHMRRGQPVSSVAAGEHKRNCGDGLHRRSGVAQNVTRRNATLRCAPMGMVRFGELSKLAWSGKGRARLERFSAIGAKAIGTRKLESKRYGLRKWQLCGKLLERERWRARAIAVGKPNQCAFGKGCGSTWQVARALLVRAFSRGMRMWSFSPLGKRCRARNSEISSAQGCVRSSALLAADGLICAVSMLPSIEGSLSRRRADVWLMMIVMGAS